MEVEVALRSLSDRFVDANYMATEGNQQIVCELAEDIRDAIREYQVSSDLGVIGSPTSQFAEALVSFHNRRIFMNKTFN